MYIPSGRQNVILYCICRRGNAALGPTRWFINNTRVTDTTGGSNPYSKNNVPAPLIIPSITSTSAGTYGCSEDANGPPRVAINLAISGMCDYKFTLVNYNVMQHFVCIVRGLVCIYCLKHV